MPAIDYRHEGLSGGKLREAEIYDRGRSEPRTIEPGTTCRLASLDGAGIVNWLRLHGRQSGAGQQRFVAGSHRRRRIGSGHRGAGPIFVSGLCERPRRKDFSTLVMARKEGFANLLAMPYGSGLAVAARNRGEKPIEKVGVSMSVDRATDKNRDDYAGRMRLRGIFQPAGSPPATWFARPAPGRWVSLVYEQPDDATTGIASLVGRRQARDGWAMTDLDPFFGRPGESSEFLPRAERPPRRSGVALHAAWSRSASSIRSCSKPNAGDKLGDRLALFYLKQ